MGRMNHYVFALLLSVSLGMEMRVNWISSNADPKGSCQCYDFRSCDALQGRKDLSAECEIKAVIRMKYDRSELMMYGTRAVVPVDILAIDSAYRGYSEIVKVSGMRSAYDACPMSEGDSEDKYKVIGSKVEGLKRPIGQKGDAEWKRINTVIPHRSREFPGREEKYMSDLTAHVDETKIMARDYDFIGFQPDSKTCYLDFHSIEVKYLLRFRSGEYNDTRGIYDVSPPCQKACGDYDYLSDCVAAVHKQVNADDRACVINHVRLFKVNVNTPNGGKTFEATIKNDPLVCPGGKVAPYDAIDIQLIGKPSESKPNPEETIYQSYDYAYSNDIRKCGEVVMEHCTSGTVYPSTVVSIGRESMRIVPKDKALFKMGGCFKFTSPLCKFKPTTWIRHQSQVITKNKPLDP